MQHTTGEALLETLVSYGLVTDAEGARQMLATSLADVYRTTRPKSIPLGTLGQLLGTRWEPSRRAFAARRRPVSVWQVVAMVLEEGTPARVDVPGLGTFRKVQAEPRTAHSPLTGEPIEVPGQLRVSLALSSVARTGEGTVDDAIASDLAPTELAATPDALDAFLTENAPGEHRLLVESLERAGLARVSDAECIDALSDYLTEIEALAALCGDALRGVKWKVTGRKHPTLKASHAGGARSAKLDGNNDWVDARGLVCFLNDVLVDVGAAQRLHEIDASYTGQGYAVTACRPDQVDPLLELGVVAF
jgi:Bacterial DNA-binding protein